MFDRMKTNASNPNSALRVRQLSQGTLDTEIELKDKKQRGGSQQHVGEKDLPTTIDDFIVQDKLGDGAYSKVFRV